MTNTLTKLKQQREKIEAEIKRIEENNNNSEWIKITDLGIEVQKETTNMTYVEAEEYCIKNNVKMLNVIQAGYIFDNDLIKDFCKEREWLEHYSKKTREKGYGCSALDGSWDLDGRLSVYGFNWIDDSDGHAFRIRFCRRIK
jgi:hypothetical protein